MLVDDQFHARLADFGLTIVGDTSTNGMTTTGSGAGSLRWKAPEFHEGSARRTTFGDIWAFGCLCIAVRQFTCLESAILIDLPTVIHSSKVIQRHV